MVDRDQSISTAVPSLQKSIARGALGFSLVSLCVFATVAFIERWMFQTLGVLGSYLTWIALFILLSGAVFGSLVVVRWRLPSFYILFALAFFSYAAAWMLAYFRLGRTTGEFIGSLVGSVLMAVVFAAGFRTLRSTPKVSAVLFVTNCLGYFLGAALFDYFRRPVGMLLFGVVYGLFFGAGIGAALQMVQRESESKR
ncbi:MAG TPA: hypothetical protein VGW58_08050 [Pyrinomonadaceae bacterium]|nr:hypothetical protein [Pyrinomonadaceae bacterium]